MSNNIINFLYAAILSGTPLLFGTIGEILSEKVGNLNLGVEGMMWLGAFAGFFAAFKTGSLIIAVLAAFGAAALGALLYAFLTVTLKANQNVTGLTLTTLGIGLSLVLGYAMTDSVGGAPKVSDEFRAAVAPVHIPFLSDIPYIGKLFFQLNPLVYLSIIIAVICAIYFKRTRVGLNVRA
ncbi:MAG: ABC transporter permease, partial [Eubacteriales bacterium]